MRDKHNETINNNYKQFKRQIKGEKRRREEEKILIYTLTALNVKCFGSYKLSCYKHDMTCVCICEIKLKKKK